MDLARSSKMMTTRSTIRDGGYMAFADIVASNGCYPRHDDVSH